MSTTPQSLARLIDHTLLKADATDAAIEQLCREAVEHQFFSVCVNGAKVVQAARQTRHSPVVVCSVVGFPLGAMQTAAKAFEARQAISEGAGEIDMVVDVGAIKSGRWQAVREDIHAVLQACAGVPLKVILENCLLTREEIIRACELCRDLQVAFVKTSTGFGSGGATLEEVSLMRSVVGPAIGVKASGGIRDRPTAEAMIAAGATRLGTSASVAIVGA